MFSAVVESHTLQTKYMYILDLFIQGVKEYDNTQNQLSVRLITFDHF